MLSPKKFKKEVARREGREEGGRGETDLREKRVKRRPQPLRIFGSLSNKISEIRATRNSYEFRNKIGLATKVELVNFRLAATVGRLKPGTDGLLLEDSRSDK